MKQAILLLLLFFSVAASAQKKLSFDEKGMLKKAPPTVYKKGFLRCNNLKVEVDADNESVNDSIKKFKERIDVLRGMMGNGASRAEIVLQEKITELKKQLGDHYTAVAGKNCCEIEVRLKAMGICDTTGKMLYGAKDDWGYCFECECLCATFNSKFDTLNMYVRKLEDYKQRKALVNLLLCTEPNRDKISYEIKYDPTTALYTYDSLPKQLAPPKINFYDIFLINKTPISQQCKGRVVGKLEKPFVQDNMELALYRQNSFLSSIINWHDSTIHLLDRKYIDSVKKWILDNGKEIGKLQAIFADCAKPCKDNYYAWQQLNKLLQQADTFWCPTSPIARWLKAWLWYSGGDFRLNYLPFTTDKLLPVKLAQKKELERQITFRQEIIVKIKALKNCTGCSILALDTLRCLQDEQAVVEDKIEALKNELAGLKLDENTKQRNEWLQLKQAIHTIKLPGKSGKLNTAVNFYNAANNFERTQGSRLVDGKLIYPENKQVYVGAYNARKKPGEFSVRQSRIKFDDRSRFTTDFSNGLDSLAGALGKLRPLLGVLNDPLAAFFGDFTNDKEVEKRAGIERRPARIIPADDTAESFTVNENNESPIPDDETMPCDSLRFHITQRLWRYELLRRMLADYEKTPTPDMLKPIEPGDASFYTFAKPIGDSTAPYTTNYALLYQKDTVAMGKFSVGRQKIISLGSGLFFNVNSARVTDADSLPIINNTDSKVKVVIGVKLYPFGLLEADGGIIPKYPAKRLSLFGGFEILKPLDNLYAGIAYDVVPGLSVSYGYHFYRRNYYKIQNNQVVDKTSRYSKSGAYWGFTLDPLVLAGVIKAFFK